MNSKVKGAFQILLVLLVTAVFGVVAYTGIGKANRGSAKNIRLGLDLAGGVSVTYEASKENPTAEEMNDTVYRMQKRVENESTEASVYQEGSNRVTVDVPDVDDPQAVLDKLGKAGSLEFVLLADCQIDQNTKDATYEKDKVLLDGSMISTAEATTQQDSSTGVSENVVKITFNGKGAKKFGDITSEHVGEQLSMIYDGKEVSSPVIQSAITDGVAVVSGNFEKFSDAEDMAATLRIGALPLELKNIRSNIVGAKLGVTFAPDKYLCRYRRVYPCHYLYDRDVPDTWCCIFDRTYFIYICDIACTEWTECHPYPSGYRRCYSCSRYGGGCELYHIYPYP